VNAGTRRSGFGTRDADAFRSQARDYYDGKLRAHGPTPAGADWNSQASQELRFRQLARLWEGAPDASILDYGCGYGAMASYLRDHGHRGLYVGFDVSESMADAARAHLTAVPSCRITARREELTAADFAVASGVLNVKQGASDEAWTGYVWETIADLAALGSRGFAFNALTKYSDPDKRRADLYYADPLAIFDRCKRDYSRFVTLLHDYPLYEFTILVRT
jgi:SAM-dependent methyltransferase